MTTERTGFAKRDENFREVYETAKKYTGAKIQSYQVAFVITRALGHLTAQERDLLAHYVSYLRPSDWQTGNAMVWPSNGLVAEFLGVSQSTVKRNKARLEQAGLIVRNYDKRNRPLEDQSIDLAPFFTEIPELMEQAQNMMKAHRRAVGDTLQERKPNLGPKGRKNEPLIQSKGDSSQLKESNISNSTQLSAKDTVPRNDTGIIRSANRSPARELNPQPETQRSKALTRKTTKRQLLPKKEQAKSVEAKLQNLEIAYAPAPMDEINQLIGLSPTLKSALHPSWNKTDTTLSLLENIQNAVSKILPGRNTASHTLVWAFERYAWEALKLLVVALEDPDISNKRSFFGYMVSQWEGDMNLERNIKRVKAMTAKAALEQKIATVSKSSGFKGFLQERISKDSWFNWFKDIEFSKEGDFLLISGANLFLAKQVKANFEGPVLTAAKEYYGVSLHLRVNSGKKRGG